MYLFDTNALIIRRFENSDAESFYELNSHPTVMRYIRPVKSRAECDAFLAENLVLYQNDSAIGRYYVAEKSTGHFAGTFSVLMMPDRDAFHVGYALMPWAQGRGWAKELLAGGLRWLAAKSNRNEIFAITAPANMVSVALLQKAGFRQEEDIVDQGKILNVFRIQRSAIVEEPASAT